MALSPFAALALPLAVSDDWREALRRAGDALRAQAQSLLDGDAAAARWAAADEAMTYMEWTYQRTGIVASYVWDPELWVRFREAVATNTPAVFWNKLLGRIEFREKIPQARRLAARLAAAAAADCRRRCARPDSRPHCAAAHNNTQKHKPALHASRRASRATCACRTPSSCSCCQRGG
jgi:hypothetical protein